MSAGEVELVPLVDAEFEVLRLLGVYVCPTSSLDGSDVAWLPKQRALLVGTDLTPEEAEEIACATLGLLVDALAVA